MDDDKKLSKTIETFDSQTRAEGFGVLDTMADLARMGAVIGGVSLRTWLESQHDNPGLGRHDHRTGGLAAALGRRAT